MKNVKKQKGFTLIELLVYMGVFSILLVVLTQIFAMILDVHLESQATSAISQDGSYIIAKLSHDIKQASAIASPAYANPPVPAASLHITSSTFDYTYQLVSSGGVNNLVLQDNTASPVAQYRLNSDGTYITSISFTTLGDSSTKKVVKIDLFLQSTTVRRGGNQQAPQEFETIVGLR